MNIHKWLKWISKWTVWQQSRDQTSDVSYPLAKIIKNENPYGAFGAVGCLT